MQSWFLPATDKIWPNVTWGTSSVILLPLTLARFLQVLHLVFSPALATLTPSFPPLDPQRFLRDSPQPLPRPCSWHSRDAISEGDAALRPPLVSGTLFISFWEQISLYWGIFICTCINTHIFVCLLFYYLCLPLDLRHHKCKTFVWFIHKCKLFLSAVPGT